MGVLKINNLNGRYAVAYIDGSFDELTCGTFITFTNHFKKITSRIEHDGTDYYLYDYPEIELYSLLNKEVTICTE